MHASDVGIELPHVYYLPYSSNWAHPEAYHVMTRVHVHKKLSEKYFCCINAIMISCTQLQTNIVCYM